MYFIVRIFTLMLVVNLYGQTKDLPKEKPTAIFSAAFWGKPTTRSILYAPWGNFEEQNSSKVMVRVSYGSLSRKCMYYGQNDIQFYQRRNYTELELDLMADRAISETNYLFSQLSFSPSPDKPKEFIVLFSPNRQPGGYQAYLLPFDKKEIPWGSYKIFSQFNETLYIAAEKKKFALDPGKNNVLYSDDFDGMKRVKILIYRKIKGEFKEVGAQNFTTSKNQRGIFFITPRRGKVQVVPLVETQRPEKQFIGFGVKAKPEAIPSVPATKAFTTP